MTDSEKCLCEHTKGDNPRCRWHNPGAVPTPLEAVAEAIKNHLSSRALLVCKYFKGSGFWSVGEDYIYSALAQAAIDALDLREELSGDVGMTDSAPMRPYQMVGMNADGNPRWPSLLLCLRCSAYISDPDVHDQWHAAVDLQETP